MCWSAEASLASFVAGSAGVAFLALRNEPNDRWMALFAGTVVMIQAAEYFMWRDQQCTGINQAASKFALLILVLEPLASILGGLYFSPTSDKRMLCALLVAYGIFALYVYVTQVAGQIDRVNWCSTSKDCGQSVGLACNLQWPFLAHFSASTLLGWVAFLLLPLLAYRPFAEGILFLGVGLATLLLSGVFNASAVGSVWCWLALSIILIKIFL